MRDTDREPQAFYQHLAKGALALVSAGTLSHGCVFFGVFSRENENLNVQVKDLCVLTYSKTKKGGEGNVPFQGREIKRKVV